MNTKRNTRRARVFTAPSRLQSVAPAPASGVRQAVQAAPAAGVAIEIKDHEATYVVGALLDAQKAAELERERWLSRGDVQQAEVFRAKAEAFGALVTRIATALVSKRR